MNRRMATLLGSAIAAVAAAEIVVLSGLLAAERHADRDRYDRAMATQRRAAGRGIAAVGPKATPDVPRTFCVHGVETFASTVQRTLQREMLDGEQRLHLDEFEAVSDLAIRAERYVETANAGPALPQRLGRVRILDGSEVTGESRVQDVTADTREGSGQRTDAAKTGPTWRTLEPPRIECDGTDAYSLFRLEIPEKPTSTDSRPSTEPSD